MKRSDFSIPVLIAAGALLVSGCGAHRKPLDDTKQRTAAAAGRPLCQVKTTHRSSFCSSTTTESCPVARDVSFRCGPMPGAPVLAVEPERMHLAFLLGFERMAYVALSPGKQLEPSYIVAPWEGRVGLAVADDVVHLFRGGQHWQRTSAQQTSWRSERVLPLKPGGAEVYLLGAGLDDQGEPYIASAGPRLAPTLLRRKAGQWRQAHSGGSGYDAVARLDTRSRLWVAGWQLSNRKHLLSLQRIPGAGPSLPSRDRAYANIGTLSLVFLPNRQDNNAVLAAYVEPEVTPVSVQQQDRQLEKAGAGLVLFLPRGRSFATLRFPHTGVYSRTCTENDARCTTQTRRILTAGLTVTRDGLLWLAYVQLNTTTKSHRALRRLRHVPYDKIDSSQRSEELRLARIDPRASPPRVELRWRVSESRLLPNFTHSGLALAASGSQLHLVGGTRIEGRGAIRYLVIDTRALRRLSFPAGEAPIAPAEDQPQLPSQQ